MRRLTVSFSTTSSEKVRKVPPETSRAISSRIFRASAAAPKKILRLASSATAAVAPARVISPLSSSAESVESGSAESTCRTIFSGEKLSRVFFRERSSRRRSHCLSLVCLPSKLSFFASVSILGAASGDISSSERISYPFKLRARRGRGSRCAMRQRRISTYLSYVPPALSFWIKWDSDVE